VLAACQALSLAGEVATAYVVMLLKLNDINLAAALPMHVKSASI
jgi:hypothetical protein